MMEIAPKIFATLSLAASARARPVIPSPAIIPSRFSPNSPATTNAASSATTRCPIDSATLARERRLAAFSSPSTTMNASK